MASIMKAIEGDHPQAYTLSPSEIALRDGADCFVCEGSGKVWSGPSDPYEGNKLRGTIACPALGCVKGRAPAGSPLAFACQAFEARTTELRRLDLERRKAEWSQRQAARQSAMAKLTEEEMRVLGIAQCEEEPKPR